MASVLPNLEPLKAVGIDPKTGLPTRTISRAPCTLPRSIKDILSVVDRNDAVNRYRWFRLPRGLNGQLIERILYLRGKGCLFYVLELDKYFFLPYTLVSMDNIQSLDSYGRIKVAKPMSFNGPSIADDTVFLPDLTRVCYYDEVLADELDIETVTTACVPLFDYTQFIGDNITPRCSLNEPIINVMSEMFPLMRTALINSTGLTGIKVDDESGQRNVEAANATMYESSISGDAFLPIVGTVNTEALVKNGTGRAEEYLMAMQAVDNFRLGTLGLESGGVFEKKSHTLQSEQAMNASNTGLVMQDGLTNRQRFCAIANSIFGTNMWCEPSETTIGVDMDRNGKIEDDASYEQNEQEVVTDEDE